MTKVILVGGGGHSKVVLNILRRDYPSLQIVGYVDREKRNLDIEYLGKEETLESSKWKGFKLVMGIGQVDIGKEREKLINYFLSLGYEFLTVISKNSIIASSSQVGEGSVVLDKVVINVDSFIGRFCILNTGCIVEHDCFVGDFVHLAPGVILSGGVRIGRNSFVGAGAIVKHYVSICDEVVIGAGGVVVRDITEKGVYVGIPAKLKI